MDDSGVMQMNADEEDSDAESGMMKMGGDDSDAMSGVMQIANDDNVSEASS